jgi:hypothetical protein
MSSAQPGSTWIYRAFYRDASPMYGAAGTFDATNGQLLSW